MPRVSNNNISNEFKVKVDKAFPTAISILKSTNDINNFYHGFMTLEEQTMMGKRLLIYVLIFKGYPAKQIMSFLGVSFESIRFHQSIYSRMDNVSKNLIKNLAEKLF